MTKPPLYHSLLGIPATSQELEQKEGVNLLGDIAAQKVVRAGFVHSDVSQNNRMIERHAIATGAYWQSYDFASSNGQQNLLANPFGPCLLPGENVAGFTACASGDAALAAARVFHHNGGEIIYSLPNGLQAYMLTTNEGKRLNEGPTSIVTDSTRPNGAVLNGVSCMGCHVKGMIRKDDEIANAVKTAPGFSNQAVVTAMKLYPKKETIDALFRHDEDRFAAAMTALGSGVANADGSAKGDPVRSVVKRFESELTLTQVAHEFGVSEADFNRRLAHAPSIQNAFASLVAGGVIKRDQFNQQFFTNIKELGIAVSLSEAQAPVVMVQPPAPPPPVATPPVAIPPVVTPPSVVTLNAGTYKCAGDGGDDIFYVQHYPWFLQQYFIQLSRKMQKQR